MNALVTTYANIAMEGVSIFYMLILLVACVLQKKRTKSNNIMIGMILLEVILLVAQIMQWEFYLDYLLSRYLPWMDTAMEYLFAADFSLMHFQTYVFFLYVYSRIEELKPDFKNESLWIHYMPRFLCIWGVSICAIVTSSIWTRQVYYQQDGLAYTTILYPVLRMASLLTSVVCVIAILRYVKVLKSVTAFLMLTYIIARAVVVQYDLMSDTCFSYIFLAIELYIIYFGIDKHRSDQLNEQSVKLALQQVELENKNTQIMVSQIQPHFLYNTLSVIDYLCGKDVETARTAINAFSDYLRMNMESINSSEPVPFEKELEHTKTYLWIEKMRFSDILNIEYDIQETDFVIPPLTLQPLCENAVKHGVRGREAGGTVRICTRRNGNTIFIHVEDDGVGFDPTKDFDDNRIHVGIQNVQKRLEMISGGRLDITSRPGIGTIATIVLNLE